MKNNLINIKCILPGSIAEEAGIEPGDSLMSINGERIKDIFDYRFLISSEELVFEILKRDGEIWEIEIEKDEYEDVGIEFETSMLDEAKSCTNSCIFCFIDQLPKGMRGTLYFKDDDSRLSFLTGNYVTLTNMNDEDIERIIKYKLSPINISVHTTNPDLRVFMLSNRFANKIMYYIEKLTGAGIVVNCQIVLCRGVNDKDELDRSILELTKLYPGVRSISIVPVGITRYRKALAELRPYDSGSSGRVIDQIEKWQTELLKLYGSRIVYLADEFYIMANREIPGCWHYEDFPQIENGVGMIALLRYEFMKYLNEIAETGIMHKGHSRSEFTNLSRHVSIATGVSSYQYINEMAQILMNRFNRIELKVFDIKNVFFGENVTVTGLLTGGDIVAQLRGKELGDELLISRSMLKSDEEIFLDDYYVKDLEKELNVKVIVVENDGEDFINKVFGY